MCCLQPRYLYNLDISLLLPSDVLHQLFNPALIAKSSQLLPAVKHKMQPMPTPIMLPSNCNSLANGILLSLCRQLCWLDVDGRLGPFTGIPHMLPARLQVEGLHSEHIACVQAEGHLQPNIVSHC